MQKNVDGTLTSAMGHSRTIVVRLIISAWKEMRANSIAISSRLPAENMATARSCANGIRLRILGKKIVTAMWLS